MESNKQDDNGIIFWGLTKGQAMFHCIVLNIIASFIYALDLCKKLPAGAKFDSETIKQYTEQVGWFYMFPLFVSIIMAYKLYVHYTKNKLSTVKDMLGWILVIVVLDFAGTIMRALFSILLLNYFQTIL